jgi:hypothetical protein
MALIAAIALSSFIFTANPTGDLTIANLRVYAVTLSSLWNALKYAAEWTRKSKEIGGVAI